MRRCDEQDGAIGRTSNGFGKYGSFYKAIGYFLEGKTGVILGKSGACFSHVDSEFFG